MKTKIKTYSVDNYRSNSILFLHDANGDTVFSNMLTEGMTIKALYDMLNQSVRVSYRLCREIRASLQFAYYYNVD